MATDDSDGPPPLEDCSELLERRQQQLLNNDNITKLKEKSKRNKSKNECGFSAGFLVNNDGKKKCQRKAKKNKKKEKLEMNSKKENPFIVDEAQNLLKQTKEWKTSDMINKLKSDDNVWNAMLSPQFGAAMQEMSKDPKAALEKYKNDGNILPTLQSVIEKMTNQSLSTIGNQLSQAHEKMQCEKNSNQSSKLFM